MIIVVLFLRRCQFGGLDSVLGDVAAQSFQIFQVMQGLCCYLPEDYVFEVQERTGREGEQEPTVVGVLLADAAQQSRSIVGQFKGLIAEGRPVDGAVAALEVT